MVDEIVTGFKIEASGPPGFGARCRPGPCRGDRFTHHDITPDTVAQVIYQQAICPTGDPQDALNDWMKVTSGLGCVLADWQRLAPGRPGYEAQTEALTTALLKAQGIMRCLARAAQDRGG